MEKIENRYSLAQCEHWMELALQEAQEAERLGEIPVGAVVVYKNKVIGRSGNRREKTKNLLDHAEILALKEASLYLNDWRLDGASVFVTLEPCPMCAGVMLQARIGSLYYGAPNVKEGCAGTVLNLLDYPGMAHHVNVYGDILPEKCYKPLRRFFDGFHV